MRAQTIALPNSHPPRDTKLTFNCTAGSRHSQHIPRHQCQTPVLKPVISPPADARGDIGVIGDLDKSIIVVTASLRRTTEESLTVFWIDVTCGTFVVPGSGGGGRRSGRRRSGRRRSGGRRGAGGGCIRCIVHFNKTSTTGVRIFFGAGIFPGWIFEDDELCARIKYHPVSVNSRKRCLLVILFENSLHLADSFEHVLCARETADTGVAFQLGFDVVDVVIHSIVSEKDVIDFSVFGVAFKSGGTSLEGEKEHQENFRLLPFGIGELHLHPGSFQSVRRGFGDTIIDITVNGAT